ncbi:hypothetical protein [Bacillus paramycoides]|uniref:hypothetical protein n=1 Tax=Bacillus paramycoides TaxID=2026194 RepID=UPI003CFC2558
MKETSIQGVLSVAEEIGSGLHSLFSTSVDYIPYIGRFVQAVKFNRLERRMKENRVQLQRINQLAQASILAEEYITQRIFPIVLADIIEEHEEAKINLLLTGFENVFIEEKEDESIVINYFDTLRNIRYKDIKRFLYLAGKVENYPFSIPGSEEEAFVLSIDNKLERQGLIAIGLTVELQGAVRISPRYPNEIDITPYGIKFLEFITFHEEIVAES